MRLIAEQAQMLTQSSGAAIALLQGEVMLCRARSGATAPDLGAPLDAQSGLSGECVRGGVTLVCEDTENDPRVNLEVCRYLGIRSIAVLPISVEGNTVGVFEVFSSHPQAFSRNEVAALESMRDLVVSVIRPAPRPESPPVSALNASASREKAAPPPRAPLISDPEDDLLCELEQRTPVQPHVDPARRAFELIRTGSQEAAARPAMQFANPDPADDLICEIEMRPYGRPGTEEPEHAHPLSTFAPAPAHPPEPVVSRKLIVLGIIVALAGLIWLRWCNHAPDGARSRKMPREHVAEVASTTAAAPSSSSKAVAPSAPEAAAMASSLPDLPAQISDSKSYSGEVADPAPRPRPQTERRIRPASSMVRKGPPPAYAGARDGPENPPVMAKPQSSPLVAPPPASPISAPAAPAPSATALARTQPATPAARAAVAPPTGTPSPLPASAPRPKDLATRLSLSQAVVTTAGSPAGNALTPQAFRLLRDSAKAGDASAQLALAISYANGEGVRQSYPDALKWFSRAQAQGVLPRGERAEQAWTKVQQWAQAHPQKY